MTFFIRLFNPKVNLPTDGIIKLDAARMNEIIQHLDRDGFYVFNEQLDEATIDAMVQFSKITPTHYVTKENGTARLSREKIAFVSSENIDSPRFQLDTEDLFQSPELKRLIFDKSLCNIAQEYFRSRPVLDLIALWWSKPEKKTDLKDYAAQKFHFDMDRIKFLKFFFYLTDVDDQNGPHVFVKGSHKNLPTQFRRDGRFEDADVISHYGKENIKMFYGKKGSIFAVDTRGIHKGEPLLSGNRLVFQIEFANSMFGMTYDKVKINPTGVLSENIKQYPLIYAPIFQEKRS